MGEEYMNDDINVNDGDNIYSGDEEVADLNIDNGEDGEVADSSDNNSGNPEVADRAEMSDVDFNEYIDNIIAEATCLNLDRLLRLV